MIPYIRVNATPKPKGCWACFKMIMLYKEHSGRFYKEYKQRNVIESVFAALKTIFGDNLRTRKMKTQKKEIAMYTVCYNLTAS